MSENVIISRSLAQTIVDAAKEVIKKEINFMDLDGEIIASTDPKRIGAQHEAVSLVKEKREVIEITDEHQLKGAKSGINYPIFWEQRMLGVIGITGNPEECRSLGFLLMKITEVLIKEQLLSRKTSSLDELRSSIVRMLIFDEKWNDTVLQESTFKIPFHLEDNAFAGVILFSGLQDLTNTPIDIKASLQRLGVHLYTYIFPNQYVFVGNESKYGYVVNELKNTFGHLDAPTSIGIGKIVTNKELAQSFQYAKLALKHAISKKIILAEYSNLLVEMLINSAEQRVKKDFKHRIANLLSTEDITLLQTYYEQNLSLKLTAEKLFIHKNTLQYRLDKIKEKTKLDPRHFHDSVQLYLALLLQTD